MSAFADQLPWFVSGPLLGLIVIGGYWAGNQALGGVGAFSALGDFLKRPLAGAPWRLFFFGGLVGGGLLFSFVSPVSAPAFALSGSGLGEGVLLVGGGLLMGLGAKHAGGCTLGHGLCGSATSSPGSLLATGTFMSVAVIVAHVLALVGVRG